MSEYKSKHTGSEIDDAVDKAHNHSNQDVLDGITAENVEAWNKGGSGSTGEDGYSPTASVTETDAGVVITITDKNGTTTATVTNGEKGDTGATGADGRGITSITGNADGSWTVTYTDGTTEVISSAAYEALTEQLTQLSAEIADRVLDQDTMVAEIIDLLGGTPVFGTVDAENNIILTGALAAGTYTVRYEFEDGTLVDIGTIDHDGEDAPTYTNLFVPADATLNTRMSGSSGAPKSADGYVMTAVIALPSAVTTGSSYDDTTAYIAVPATMWTNSASLFGYTADGLPTYVSADVTAGTVVGDFIKVPLYDQWDKTYTITTVVLSLYVSTSAISLTDIQDIAIYFNELPE